MSLHDSKSFTSSTFRPVSDIESRLFGQAHVRSKAVTIVVPCYNESKRLDVMKFAEFVNHASNVKFLFVDDGSKDETLEVLDRLHNMVPERTEVIALRRNSGKAEAVRQGLLHALANGAELVGYWDADLATPLDAIFDFRRIANRFADVDVIFGSRKKMLGHRIERTLTRRAISRVSSLLARFAVRLPIADTQCGAKLFRNTNTLHESLASPFTAGWLFDVELFTRISARTENRGRAFFELPLAEWNEIAGSKVTGGAVFKSGFQMLRLIAESRFGLSPKSVRGNADKLAPTITGDPSSNVTSFELRQAA